MSLHLWTWFCWFNFFLMVQWPLETVQIQGLEEYYTVFPNCLAGVTLSFVVGK